MGSYPYPMQASYILTSILASLTFSSHPKKEGIERLIMATLRSRCGRYILQLWFLLSFFPSPILSHRRLDVYHTSTHDVAVA